VQIRASVCNFAKASLPRRDLVLTCSPTPSFCGDGFRLCRASRLTPLFIRRAAPALGSAGTVVFVMLDASADIEAQPAAAGIEQPDPQMQLLEPARRSSRVSRLSLNSGSAPIIASRSAVGKSCRPSA
jgi:hypothetical protein